MSKSLSELRLSPDVGRPEKPYDICVAGKLAAELEEADRELFGIEEQLQVAQGDRERSSRRLGEKPPEADLQQQAQAAAERSDEIRRRMTEHTVTLHLVGKPSGEWRRWAAAHPARDEEQDEGGAKRDQRYAGGWCDIDALIADLGGYTEGEERRPGWIERYGEEPASDEWWQFVAANAAPGDLTMLASTVVGMHEQVVDLGKSRVAWQQTRRSDTSSE